MRGQGQGCGYGARLKITFVSRPAGGRNCGQSGGRNFISFFFLLIWGVWLENIVHILRKKLFFFGKKEKKVPSCPLLTHPAAGPET